MGSMLDTIRRRVSCRSYSDIPVAIDCRRAISAMLDEPHRGPFNGRPRFRSLEFPGGGGGQRPRLGTYGFITGATLYIAGAVTRHRWAGTDFGYCMEGVILRLTALGLGTCWLEATYDRARMAREFGLKSSEFIPAVTPVGYPARHRTLVDRAVKLVARSNVRRPWDQMFFAAGSGTPLAPGDAGEYADCLESVRLAPSSTNRQPWRVAVDRGAAECHFYSRGNPKLDLGIAMHHFEAVAREQGLGGRWLRLAARDRIRGLTYVATWTTEAPGEET